MRTLSIAVALLAATSALAAPPSGSPNVSGATTVTGADAPKTTTSGNERLTTDAAGLGPPAPGAHPVPKPGKPPKHNRHPRTPPL
jgi:hypothetical protein